MKTIAVLVFLALYGALCYHLGGLGPKLSGEKTTAKQETAEAAQAAKQLVQNQAAEDKRDAELQSLPVPATYPVYILREHACPAVHVPAQAAAPVAASRSADAGSRGDPEPNVRLAFDAFERKYETALADCREDLAKWPTP